MATLMTPQEAEEFVVSTNRYNRTRPRTPTTTLASFTYSDDREVTIELKSKRPQIWLDDGNWLSEDVKALFSNGIVFYEAGAPRQSNIKKINGHKAMARIKVPTLDLLAQLLAAYEGTDRREPYGPRRRTPPGETGPVLKAGRATLGKKATASLKLRAYFDEYAGEGNTQGYGGGKRTVEHGAIVKALEAHLRADGDTQKAQAIDLALVAATEVDLFEVKTSSRATDVYTGIGQLLIHGECITELLGLPVRRHLILPDKPNAIYERHISGKFDINVVTFKRTGDVYRFVGLPSRHR